MKIYYNHNEIVLVDENGNKRVYTAHTVKGERLRKLAWRFANRHYYKVGD